MDFKQKPSCLSRRNFTKAVLGSAVMTVLGQFSVLRSAGARQNGQKEITMGPTQVEKKKRIQNSPHFKDGEFQNPINVPMMAPGSTVEYIREKLFGERIDPVPIGVLPLKTIKNSDWTKIEQENFSFVWLGHSSILIAVGGKTVLVDPVLEERASPFSWFGPKRFHPAPISARELPPIDVVLITHDHYDHLEESTIRQLRNKTGLFLAPLGIGELFEKWEVPPEKFAELDWWEAHHFGSIKFTATPAVHYARRGLFDGNERLWCSWSVRAQNQSCFISGDSGYYDGFKEIGRKLGPFDVSFLKIGSYDDKWKQIHMLPEEAVQQHLDLGGKLLVPLHWATFDLAQHSWYEPIERMLTAARNEHVQYATPLIGEKVNTNRLPKNDLWWRRVGKDQG
jgi:L-ascorbate metabolism protein UlaG (beta-lactamase superfamily)